ncbi:MAG: hypothetical protein EOM47_09065 [Bacteroidia bacterium]|nr:hypothetical protein [Bacteroidia bacterium]
MDMTYQAVGFDWFSMVSLVLNIIFGGGLIVTLVTLKAQKKQAEATAKQAEASAKQTEASAETTEIENLKNVALGWREYAESAEARYKSMSELTQKEVALLRDQVNKMEETIKRLTSVNNQIFKIVKDINHENIEQKKAEAKEIAGA